jgi:hypothetical protein
MEATNGVSAFPTPPSCERRLTLPDLWIKVWWNRPNSPHYQQRLGVARGPTASVVCVVVLVVVVPLDKTIYRLLKECCFHETFIDGKGNGMVHRLS